MSKEKITTPIEISNLEEQFAIPIFQLSKHILNKVWDLKRYIEGRMLTIIDASIADLEQRKALKDIVREALHAKEYHTDELFHIMEEFDSFSGLNGLKDEKVRKEFLRGFDDCPRRLSEKYFKN